MGWTTMHYTGTRQQFAMDEFNREPEHGTVIKAAVVGTTIYIAYRLGSNHGAAKAGMVTALVILTSIDRKDRYNFGYKNMDETVGPNESKCPKSILNLLTPIEELYPDNPNNYAKAWRERCYAHANKPAEVKLAVGTIIKTVEPLNFKFGVSADTFECVKPNIWRMPNGCLTRFRASRFEHTIVNA